MPVISRYVQHLQFGASHVLAHHPTCSKVHGHSYHVALTFEGEPVRENWGYPVTEVKQQMAIGIVHELRFRHLNDMIPAGEPTALGVAQYLLERTRMLGVSKVEVHESDTDAEGVAEHLSVYS